MLSPSMNSLMKKINNKYLLVNITSQRARDIANDYDNTKSDNNIIEKKSVQLALEDIANGKIELQKKNRYL